MNNAVQTHTYKGTGAMTLKSYRGLHSRVAELLAESDDERATVLDVLDPA